MNKVASASFAGAVLEWYDFFIFGTAAALVFGPLFFPSEDRLTGIIAAFAASAVGFLARPLGGLVFGHFGDRVGRKKSLLATLVIIGVATTLIGCLPTYGQVGIWAPILLSVLRLLQGFGLGGEYAGAALLTIEHAPEGKRGFWGSVPQSAAAAGVLLATGVFALVMQLPEDAVFSWGWRIPFLLSSIMMVVGLVIRFNITETPDFKKAVEEAAGKPSRPPLLILLKESPRALLLTIGARLAETTASNVINTFTIVYVSSQLAMDRSIPLRGVLIASAIGIFMCPLVGWLSDRVGRRTMYVAGAAFMALFAFPYFMLLNTQSVTLIFLAMVLGFNFGQMTMFAVQPTFFSELFGAGVRYTGLSIAYQFSAIFGGFSPLIAASLLKFGGGEPWYVAMFLAVVCLVSLICAVVVKGDALSVGVALGKPGTLRGGV